MLLSSLSSTFSEGKLKWYKPVWDICAGNYVPTTLQSSWDKEATAHVIFMHNVFLDTLYIDLSAGNPGAPRHQPKQKLSQFAAVHTRQSQHRTQPDNLTVHSLTEHATHQAAGIVYQIICQQQTAQQIVHNIAISWVPGSRLWGITNKTILVILQFYALHFIFHMKSGRNCLRHFSLSHSWLLFLIWRP